MPLVRYNPLSVLRNINLADIEEVKDVMNSIARCLDTTAGAEGRRIAEQALAIVNKTPILRIVQAIENFPEWPLLRMAVERLLETRGRSRLEILGAVSELEHLADEKVLISPTVWPKEYSEALEDFLDLPPLSFSQPSQSSKNGEVVSGLDASSFSKKRVTRSISNQSHRTKSSTKSSLGTSASSYGVEKESAGEKKIDLVTALDTIKPARTPLPDLPDSKVILLKSKPTTPHRKKRPAPTSDEYAVSSAKKSSAITPKRGKTAKACDECRRRKTKCLRDEGEEKCNSCVKMGRECILSSPSPPKSNSRIVAIDSAIEESAKVTTKTETVVGPKTEMKNILHDFGNLKEGKALGIVSDADEEDSGDGVEYSQDAVEASKVVATISDSGDHEYHPNKRVCRPGKKIGAKSVRKVSSIAVE
ncbi:uncharacterized protein RSE6_11009 [Rhynchosporium secalis]|uniref:Zn(2)-C6 fungal-type domain-containing protein n=1 Tax=Rhynchosporium secalis TaxID=38038 RepID=A0A1E1MLW3_RHYSE|nr:uncharacterized protein RSE6_11009 [Rhynchosporium secalis]